MRIRACCVALLAMTFMGPSSSSGAAPAPAKAAPAPAKAAPAPAKAAPAPAKAAPAAKVAPAAKAAPAAKGLKLAFAPGKLPAARRQWKITLDPKAFVKGLALGKAHAALPRINSYSKDVLTALAGKPKAELGKLPATQLARALYVLSVEAPSTAKKLEGTLQGLTVTDKQGTLNVYEEVREQVNEYRELYDVPCSHGQVARMGAGWPPKYSCSEAAEPASDEPVPYVTLRSDPKPAAPLKDPGAEVKAPKELVNAGLATERKQAIAQRDVFTLEAERVEVKPSKFCVAGKGKQAAAGLQCKGTYAEVLPLLYPGAKPGEKLPVFCAPQKLSSPKKVASEAAKDSDVWDLSSVVCSASWTDTLGGWKPWNVLGKAAKAPERGSLPPVSCFSQNILSSYVTATAGGADAGGFVCRRRVFRFLANDAAMNQGDVERGNANLCQEMRWQTWGEKYPDILEEYRKWCVKEGRKDCANPSNKSVAGQAPDLPFMSLSREELLYFFGHAELYCRADRPGLIHFLYNADWAKTFTCGVSRGLIEAGPFEEGVQACAVTPYAGDKLPSGALTEAFLRARLHCWQFSRPTCEEISKDRSNNKEADLLFKARSSVFDAYDMLREFRRTRDADVFKLLDAKDVEKKVPWEQKLAFQDTERDESDFGVKKFCRFVDGTTRKLRCGYNKESVGRWYELHKDEKPEGCASGVCVRGAHQRGYYCGLFRSADFFASKDFPSGEPFWMCGIDTGWKGRALLEGASAVCVGGARARQFQSAKGDTSSLQCYGRVFKWGETEKSEEILGNIEWTKLVEKAVVAVENQVDLIDSWLHGGQQATDMHEDAVSRVKELRDQAEAKYAARKKEVTDQYTTMFSTFPFPAPLPAALIAQLATKSADEVSAQLDKTADEAQRATLGLTGKLLLSATTSATAFKAEWVHDRAALLVWVKQFGHTLGHRTSLWRGLLTAKIPAIEQFKKLKFAVVKDFSYSDLGGKFKFTSRPSDPEELKAFKARDDAKARALNDLVQDVLKGLRSADARWYQAFRIEATEARMLRVDPKELAVALRVHHLFEALDLARKGLLSWAREYAKEVFAAARKKERPLQTRLELHETARDEIMPSRFKGNVFCVPLETSQPAGKTRYACATSPLLMAGTVELRSVGAWGDKLSEKQQQQLRSHYKSSWCYGGTRRMPLFGFRRSMAALDPNFDLDSPYELDVPAGVATPHKALKDTQASIANWLKCSGFQYSDSSWEEAVPRPEPARPVKKAVAGKAAGGNLGNLAGGIKSNDPDHEISADDRKDAMSKAGDLLEKVGPILKTVLQLAAPELANIEEKLRDAAQVGSEFISRWNDKLVAKMTPTWQQERKKVDDAEKAVSDKRAELLGEWKKRSQAQDDARAEWQAAELTVASDPKNPNLATLKDKAKGKKEAWTAAGQALKQLDGYKPLQEAEKALATAGVEAQKLKLPSDLINVIVDELSSEVSGRVMGFLKPIVGSLVDTGFGVIRSILEPILGAVISAIGSIPFVGGALAMLAQVAFTLVMDQIKEAVTNGVLGIAEGFIAKLVRQVIGPLFRFVKDKLIALVHSACSAFPGVCPAKAEDLRFGELGPKDRWLEKVLACKSASPLIGDWELREAAHARVELQHLGKELRENAPAYAAGFASRALARHGFTYESFLAATRAPTDAFVAQAKKLARMLGEQVVAARAQGRTGASR